MGAPLPTEAAHPGGTCHSAQGCRVESQSSLNLPFSVIAKVSQAGGPYWREKLDSEQCSESRRA